MAKVDRPGFTPGQRIQNRSNIAVEVGIVGAGPFNVRTISAELPARTILVVQDQPRRGDIYRLRPEAYVAVAQQIVPGHLLYDPKYDHYDVYIRDGVLRESFESPGDAP
jgi:hypothetical protein